MIPHKFKVDGGCCDDGVHPDARGGAWRIELLIVGAILAAFAILAATTIAARIEQHRTEASK